MISFTLADGIIRQDNRLGLYLHFSWRRVGVGPQNSGLG